MTIAAGFRYDNGVLLCADMQQEGGNSKFFATKLGALPTTFGDFCYAYAGNSNFAITTVQKCSAELMAIRDRQKFMATIERVVDRQYRKSVYTHPDRHSNFGIDYWLLLSFYDEQGKASLFATHDTTMRRIDDYVCVGVGQELARYLIRPTFHTLMDEGEVIRLASYILDRVKNNVPGCGGPSEFLVIRDSGEYEKVSSAETYDIQHSAAHFDRMAQELFFKFGSEAATDKELHERFNTFKEWLFDRREHQAMMRQLLSGFEPTAATPPGPPHPTDEQSPPLPLPESSEESGES